MLKQDSYWESEDRVPLMAMNKGFLDRNNLEHAFERASKWVGMFEEPLEVKKVEWPNPPQEPARIIVKDVERTFTADEFRDRLSRTLTMLNNEFGDYHQGMSFLVSFLGLFMGDDEIVAIARRLNGHKDFIPGYWKHEAVDFVRDAYVLDHLLSLRNPAIHHHLAKNHIMPGTYPQKWFVALCVHVLPFDVLFAFLDRFFKRGVRFLFQFGLGFFETLKEQILKSDNPVNIFGYLRLDRTVVSFDDSTYMAIIDAADTFDLHEIKEDDALNALRKRMYDTYLGARFEDISAKNAKAEQEEDSDLDWDEDGEAEPGTECEVCTNMAPDFWCLECKKFVCGMCNDKSRAPHSKTHKMVSAASAPPEAYERSTDPDANQDAGSQDSDEDVQDIGKKLADTDI
jgi:hypothetical protein